MKKLSPDPAPKSRRVFVACLLSFTILITPLAAIAAPRSVGGPTVRERNVSKTSDKGKIKFPAREALINPPLPAPVPAVVTVTATMVDAIENDDGDSKIDPTNGVPATTERIKYTVTINNTGSDATGVAFADTIDSHTTFVAGSLNVSPLAGDDTYATIGNTLLEVGPVAAPSSNPKVTVAGSVLDNDIDFLGAPAPTLKTPFPTTSTNGGTVAMESNGRFSYTPAADFSGVDTFTYTITDAGADAVPGNADDLTSTGTVTINVNAQKVWYVKNDAPGGGTGTSTSPFNTLLAAQTASDIGETIFVFFGNGTTSGQNAGITLKASQRFIGEGVQLDVPVSVNGGPNPTVLRSAGSKPLITNTIGDGVAVGNISGVSIRGFNIAGSVNAVGVTFTAAGGGVTISNNTITGGTGNAIDVTTSGAAAGGSATITNNVISGAGAEGIDINANGTGTLTVDVNTNTLNAIGNAFDLSENGGVCNLNFSSNTNIISANAAGSAVNILRVAGTTTVTGFANNQVSGNSAGTGVSVSGGVTFDAVPGGNFDAVAGGTTVIGSVGNGVGVNGVVLGGISGNLVFTDLDIVNDNGTGLSVTGTGVLTANTGTGISVGAGVGTIASTGGPAVNISGATMDLQLVSIISTNSPTTGVTLSGNGTFSAGSGSSITNATGDDFAVGSGTANITYNGPLNNSGAGNSVDVTGHTGGTVAFTGAITDTGLGVNLNSNTGATINFMGGLSISTGANAAFTATGAGPAATTGGTVNVCDENPCNPGATGVLVNTLTTTTGTALNVANTTIGSNKLEFKSISAGTGASGPASGIILNNTGSSGGLIVKGDGNTSIGGNNSGGVIQHTTQYGISLTSTNSPSFTNMNIHDIARNGIDGFGVTNFTFANGTVATTGTASLAGDFDVNSIAFVDRSGADNNTIDGTVSITGSTITDPERNAIMIETWAGTISSLTISNNTLSGGTTNARIQNAIQVFSQGSASGTGSITTGAIQNNNISDFRFFDTAPAIDVWIGGNGIRVVGGNPNAASTSATLGTVANPILITGNDIDNVGSNMIAVTFAGKTGISNFTIQNNGTSGDKMTNAEGNGISVFFGGNGTFNALVDNNWIDGIDQGGNPSGSKGIAVQSDFGLVQNSDVTNSNITVSNNNISNTAGDGIQATGINNAGTFNVRVVNNTVTTVPDLDARYGIRVQHSNVGTQPTLNLEINGNTTQGAFNAFHVLGNGIGVRKQDPFQFGIEGLNPTPTNAPEAYINSQNPAGHGTDKLAGTGFIAQNVALYRPKSNKRDDLALGGPGLPSHGSDSLLASLVSGGGFASIFRNLNTATPFTPALPSNNIQPLLANVAVTSEGNTSREPASPTMLAGAANSVARFVSAVDSLIVPTASAETAKAEDRRQKSEIRSQRSDVRLNHAKSRRAVTTKAATRAMAPMPSGETLNATIGTLPANKSVTITFTVTLNNPPNLSLLNPPRVRNQGTVSGTNFASVLTDDTALGGATDPTDTPVDLFDTTTSLSSDLNPSNFGDQVTFTATVSESPAQGSVDPTGTVNFIDTSNGNAVICNAVALTSGQAQCQTSSLSASTHNMQAVYSGDGNFDTSTSNTVAQVVNPCLTNPIVTSTADSGANTLRDSLANVCSAPNNNVTFNLGAGPHTITALSTLVIAKNVNVTNTLSGTNGSLTVTANGGNFRVFRIDSPVTTASLSNFTVTGASVTSSNGGGLLVQSGTATLTGMLFTGNTVINSAGGGLGVTGGATLNVRNSTVSGNTATFGGGLYNNGGTLNLLNVTVTNNTADGNVGGGPIGGAGAVGGGIETGGGIATNIKNSIVAGNFATTGTNISGTSTDQGNNILSGDPMIAALANNGGATRTHALLPTSPAVDAGDNTAASAIPLTTDQRGAGFPRIADSADADTTATVDIGAFELHPSIEDIPDKNTPEDTPLSVGFNIGDGTGALITSVIATSSNTTLVPNANLVITGSGSTRTLNITPASNTNTPANGTATITVTVTATNGQTAQDTFVLTVDAVNDAPSFVKGADQTVNEDAGAQTVIGWATSISKGPADEAGQTLTFNISQTSSTGSLSFSSGPAIDPATGNLTYTTAADTNGTANFSVTLSDNGSNTPPSSNTSGAQTFMITVNPINDPPSFTKGADPNINENAGAQTVVGWATSISQGPNETGQTLTFNVTANGSTGTLTFSTPPAINATTGTLTYTPNNGTNGTATFNVTLSDNGSNVAPNSNTSAVQSFTITVDSINDPPVNTVPGAQSIPKNTVFTFSGANSISVADPDAAQAPSDGVITVTLTATNGTLTLGGTAGLSFSVGDGVADTTMTFDGTIPAINTALNGASFTPTLNYTGPATVQIVSNDQGKTGPGGPKTDTDTINFTVNALLDIYLNEVNFNPPGTDAPNEYIELRGTPSSTIPAGTYFVAIEGDSVGNQGDVQTLINLSGLSFGSNGFLVLLQNGNTYTTAAGATVVTSTTTGFGGLPGAIFQADSAATDIEDASVTFMLIQTGVAPGLADDIDANNDGTADGSTFAGWAVRDSIGILDGTNGSRGYGAINFSNAGGGTSSGTVVSTAFTGGYVGRIGDSTGSTAADWVASGALGGAAPNWTLGISTQTEPSTFAGKPLNHIGASNFVNLPPVNTVPGAQATNEDTPLVFTGATQISIADADAGSAAMKVTLTAVNGTFSLSGIAGLSFTTGDGTNDTQMVFTGTISAINTALNNLTFTPPSNFFSPPVASLTILTEDQGNTGVGGNQTDSDTINITVNAVNDPPSFALSGNPPAVNEDAGGQTVNSFATSISQGPGESGQTLTFNVSANGTTGNLAFSSGPAIDSSTGTLTYTTSANTNGTATFNVTLSDNGSNAAPNSNTSGVQQFTITVNEVADTPSVTNATTNEDTQTTTGLVISRNAADSTGVTHFKITGITNGTLFQNNGTTQINNGDFITFAQGNAGLKFTPAANLFSPTTTFSFTVQASTSNVDGGLGGSTVNATITVNPIADTPSVTNAVTSINTETTSGLVISRNVADSTEVTHFKITNITNGTLFQGDHSSIINNNDFITFAQGNAGLKFRPAFNLTDPTAFGFDVQASLNNTNGGIGGGTAHATINVNCTSPQVVTSTLDDGSAGTLRYAVLNICPASGNITFNLPVGPQTILLGSQITINKDVTIIGPADQAVTVSRGGAGRVFGIATGAGNVNISNLTITGGFSFDGSGGGGALLNTSAGTVTLTGMTLSGNLAESGGAIATSAGTINIYNSTISGNTANTDGGGVSHNTAGTVNLLNSTVTNNTATGGQGGGVQAAGGTTNIKNTIVAGNTAPTNADVGGTIVDQGNNVLSGDPKLGPLAINGGPTQTHALKPGSPALDAGDNTAATNAGLTTDQRGAGFGRIRDAASDTDTTQTVDIGAFEADPSVEDITDKTTTEDTALPSFIFKVADSFTAFDSITATSSNTTLVPNANITVGADTASTRTLSITPAANQSGSTTITVTVTKTIGSTAVSMSDTFVLTVGTIPDTPSVTNAVTNEDAQSTSGLVITRNAVDGAEITHFKITSITGGTLFKNDGVTVISNNTFITAAEGNAGLKFTPAANSIVSGSFQVQSSTDAIGTVLSSGAATATITVNAVADTPSITNATTNEDTQTTSGLVISRNAADGAEVTHFRITGITNGTLFKSDGTTPINNGDFITFAEGNAGLKFTPAANLFSPGTTFSFQVQAATSSGGAGLSAGFATATITVNTVADTPSVTNATTLEDTQTASGLVITRNAADGAEVTNFKITGITGGTLFQNNGTTVINNNDFITVAQGGAGLRFTPTANSNANGSFQVQASLNNTNAGLGGSLATATITVTPVNDAPTLDALGNLNINEDAPLQTVNLTGISAGGGETQTLVVTATSNNSSVVPNPTVNYTSPNATGSLTFTPVANANGSAIITVTVNDGGGTANGGIETVVRTFTVTVNAVNDAPSFTKGPDQTVNEDAAAQTINNWATAISPGPADESAQTVNFQVTGNTNAALFSALPAISSTGTLTYTPAANANGSATITIALIDNGGTALGGQDTSATQTFTITVNAVNDTPSFVKGANQTVNEDAGLQTVANWATAISAGPADESSQTVSFNVSNNNNSLFSGQPAVSSTGTLTYTPAANANGSATVSVSISDNGGTANGGSDTSTIQTFSITVNAVNDAPSFTKGPDQTIQDPNPQSIPNWATNISAGPADEAGQTLTFLVSNNSNVLFSAQPAISPNGTLTFTAAAGQDGVATVTVRLQDNGGTALGGVDTSAPQAFTITVHALNNAPTLNALSNLVINEDASLQTVNLAGITTGASFESNQTLTITATSSNTALIPNPSVTYTNPDTTGSISFTPLPDANGSVLITVTVKDNGGTANGGIDTFVRTFTVTVNAVDDAPVNHVPGAQIGVLNTSLVFSTATSNLISISDVDAGSDPVQVTLKATDGTLTLSSTSGLSFSAGDGTDDALMTFTGTIANINLALNGMRNLTFGTGVITITTNDLGRNGSGGPLSDTDTIAVTVNDTQAPLLLTVEGTDRAIALDSVTLLRDPFGSLNDHNFSSDHRTRIALFALHAQLLPGETAAAVTAEAQDLGGNVFPLTVESVRTVPGFDWLTQVVVKLPEFMQGGGGPQDIKVRIRVHGQNSNQAVFTFVPGP